MKQENFENQLHSFDNQLPCVIAKNHLWSSACHPKFCSLIQGFDFKAARFRTSHASSIRQ